MAESSSDAQTAPTPPELRVPEPRSRKGSKRNASVKRSPSNPFFLLSSEKDRRRSGVATTAAQTTLDQPQPASANQDESDKDVIPSESSPTPSDHIFPASSPPPTEDTVPFPMAQSQSPRSFEPTEGFDLLKSGLRQRLASDEFTRGTSSSGSRNRKSSNASVFSVTSNASQQPVHPSLRGRKDSSASVASQASLHPSTAPRKLQKSRPSRPRAASVYSDAQDSMEMPPSSPPLAPSLSSPLPSDQPAFSSAATSPATSPAPVPAQAPSHVAVSVSEEWGQGHHRHVSFESRLEEDSTPAAAQASEAGLQTDARPPLVLVHSDDGPTDQSEEVVPQPASSQPLTHSWTTLAHWVLSSPIYMPLQILASVPLVSFFIPQLQPRPSLAELLFVNNNKHDDQETSQPERRQSEQQPAPTYREDPAWLRWLPPL